MNFGSYDNLASLMTAVGQRLSAVANSLAEPFDPTLNYWSGRYVTYNGQLYVFTTDHRGTPWNPNDVQLVQLTDLLTSIFSAGYTPYDSILDSSFSTGHSYSIGDLAWYRESTAYPVRLYRFTADHQGAWNFNDVESVTIYDLIGDLENTLYALSEEIAPEFDSSDNYAAGAYVNYEGLLYQFRTAHPAGDWTGSDVRVVTVGGELKNHTSLISANTSKITTLFTAIGDQTNYAFNPTYSYSAGEYVWYENLLYKFISAHAAGAWTGSDVTAVTVIGELEALAGGGSSTLAELSDVNLSLLTNNQIIKYNNTLQKWENTSLNASDTNYNNSSSGLTATNVQNAIDEVVDLIGDVESLLAAL